MRPVEWFSQDARIALRVLRRSAGTTALGVLSVALGIGLTTALFSVTDAILLRPFPLERPGQVLQAWSLGDDGRPLGYGWPDYEDMARAGAPADLAAYERKGGILTVGDESRFVLAYAVSNNFFSFLGVPAALGRTSLDAVDGRPAAVLGHRIWQRAFGGDPSIIGRTVLLNNHAFRVAGVMPSEFTGLTRLVANDIWVSTDAWFNVLGRRDEQTDRDMHGDFEIVARLKPGANAASVASQFDAVIRGPGKYKPAPKGTFGTVLESRFAPGWKATLVGGGGLLLVLGLVLFAACANVAQLRLAQAEARRKELGVRMALGAGTWGVIRQLLAETVFVTLAGAGLGILLARILMEKTVEFLATRFTYIDPGIRLDSRVLAFALAASLAAVVMAGFAPARHAVRISVAQILKTEQGTMGGSQRSWQKRFLIAGQVAVSVVLFGLATWFLQSFRNAAHIQPGLDPSKRLLLIAASRGGSGHTYDWCREASDRIAAVPGVRAATFARRLPLSGSGGGMTVRVELPGQPPLGVGLNNVAGNYFRVMGTHVLAGRGIDDTDRRGGPLVVAISQRLARQAFGTRNPLGEWIKIEGQMRQVVGITEDAPSNDLHEALEPFVYLPFAQMPSGDFTLIAETGVEPQSLEQPVRRELKRFDPSISAMSFTTLRHHIQQALTWDQFLATLSTALGIIGFLLTGAGLFGVIHFAVNRRTREIGLRMSLGAQPHQIRRMVMGESVRIAAWGIPLGLALLAAAGWYVRSAVLGVSPLQPFAYIASAAAAVAVAITAAWLPARRATRVDPMAALRTD